MTEAAEGLRLDKWLFYARFFKTRSLAAGRIEGGGIRVNGQPCHKPGRVIRPGDRLTVSAHGRLRVLTVTGLAERRGPASDAQQLYAEDRDGLIDPPEATR